MSAHFHSFSSLRPPHLRGESSSLQALPIRWAGQRFDLHAARGMYWRRARTLIIADPHFGKAAAFRHAGVPVPAGTTQADVDRVTALLQATRAKRLIVLGDFFHARSGRADSTMAILQDWRHHHAKLEIILVRGNHDQHAGDPPPEWGFVCVDEPFIDDRFAFRHAPAAACGFARSQSSELFTFAGHIHPCAILRDIDGSALRVPCFFFAPDQAILPAFGAFTGMHPVRPRPRNGDRVFAIGPESVAQIAVNDE